MRLLTTPPADGAWNMALDEALLDGLATGGPATLRFYQWSPATVSLGYFQPINAYDERATELAAFGLVRRPTGGGAILHDAELTYSLAVPADWAALNGHANRLYRLAHEAIAAGLHALGVPARFHEGPAQGNAQRGPFFCFARRHTYDLLVGGDKIVGSAQRRKTPTAGRHGAILQHGSIILARVAPQPCAGVNDHRASAVSPAELAELLAPRLAAALSAELVSDGVAGAEQATANTIAAKYQSAEWTRQR